MEAVRTVGATLDGSGMQGWKALHEVDSCIRGPPQTEDPGCRSQLTRRNHRPMPPYCPRLQRKYGVQYSVHRTAVSFRTSCRCQYHDLRHRGRGEGSGACDGTHDGVIDSRHCTLHHCRDQSGTEDPGRRVTLGVGIWKQGTSVAVGGPVSTWCRLRWDERPVHARPEGLCVTATNRTAAADQTRSFMAKEFHPRHVPEPGTKRGREQITRSWARKGSSLGTSLRLPVRHQKAAHRLHRPTWMPISLRHVCRWSFRK